MREDKKKEEKEFSFIPYIVVAGLVFTIVITSYIINFYDIPISKDSGTWGTFGDFIGGTLNPIFAFLSFIALLYTIKLQSNELKASREELELTRDELARSADTQKEQSESIKLQNFENTFFNMLKLHTEIIDKMIIREKSKQSIYEKFAIDTVILEIEKNRDFIGKEVISILFVAFEEYIIKKDSSIDIRKAYTQFYKEFNDLLGHYFRNIYQILKYIESQKDEKLINKKFYSNILRAQLSNSELALLLINGLSRYGSQKLLPLLIKYEFMEPLHIKKIDNKYLRKLTLLCIEQTSLFNKRDKLSFEKWKIFGSKSEWKRYINRYFKTIPFYQEQ